MERSDTPHSTPTLDLSTHLPTLEVSPAQQEAIRYRRQHQFRVLALVGLVVATLAIVAAVGAMLWLFA